MARVHLFSFIRCSARLGSFASPPHIVLPSPTIIRPSSANYRSGPRARKRLTHTCPDPDSSTRPPPPPITARCRLKRAGRDPRKAARLTHFRPLSLTADPVSRSRSHTRSALSIRHTSTCQDTKNGRQLDRASTNPAAACWPHKFGLQI